ncbi:cytochrome c biogenesis protein ResB, partial [bacterium]|nr:cytochrome c biogenesis protein ResB [bacterium]
MGFVLIVGFISLRKLIRAPALLLIHLGCILVLVGAMYGSEDGQEIPQKLFGIDRIRRGQMLIHQNQESNQVKLEKGDQIKELPFSIRLKDFRIEYYEPKYLQIQTRQGNAWKIPVELNSEFDLGSEFGKVKILKQFQNFIITFDGGTRKVMDSSKPGCNPALEVQIEYPDGAIITRYVFERFPGHTYPQDKFLLAYKGVVRDYISDLAVIENGNVVAEKNVEVNHPLHFG